MVIQKSDVVRRKAMRERPGEKKGADHLRGGLSRRQELSRDSGLWPLEPGGANRSREKHSRLGPDDARLAVGP